MTRHLYTVDGWGAGELWHLDGVVVQHELARPELEGGDGEDDATGPAPAGIGRLCDAFARHLRGEPVSYDHVELDVGWATPFQQALAAAVRSIAWGSVASYGEVAELAGRPRAARAAGTFCAENRFALIVPCHRVVAADGIGGYGPNGVGLKRRLLALEGVVL